MRKNVNQVFQKFLSGMAGYGPKNRDGNNTVWTDGTVIYSYKMPIAVKVGERAAFVSQESPTVTTSIHRNEVRHLLCNHGFAVAMCDASVVKKAAELVTGPGL